MKNTHMYYSRHAGVMGKENRRVNLLCWPAGKCCFSFCHTTMHFCFYELPKFFFFPLYFLEILSNIMSYGKHMENQDFPTQSNFRHLRRSWRQSKQSWSSSTGHLPRNDKECKTELPSQCSGHRNCLGGWMMCTTSLT